MPNYKQGKYIQFVVKLMILLYMLVVQLNHYVKEWQNMNMILWKDPISVFINMLMIGIIVIIWDLYWVALTVQLACTLFTPVLPVPTSKMQFAPVGNTEIPFSSSISEKDVLAKTDSTAGNHKRQLERVCCLLVLNLVSSTLPCIRRTSTKCWWELFWSCPAPRSVSGLFQSDWHHHHQGCTA